MVFGSGHQLNCLDPDRVQNQKTSDGIQRVNIVLFFIFTKEVPELAERVARVDPQIGISAGAHPDSTLIPMSRLRPRLFEDIRYPPKEGSF